MNRIWYYLEKAELLISNVAKAVCVFCLMAIFVMFIANVFVRFVPIYNFTQTDDWIQICLIWMIFLGAQELVRTRSHFVVDVLSEHLGDGHFRRMIHAVVATIELVTYAVICWFGVIWVNRAHSYFQSIPWLEVRWAYAAIPVSAFLMTLYALKHFIEVWKEKEVEKVK